ncbi:MAG: PAS domain S-box protein [Polyangiaceae bacterium]|nr:PAS domain S-box protein [Polyangiaceae bacterium]
MLEELLRASDVQHLFESYYSLIKIPVAIIDLRANVLLSSRWQRICSQFHRVNAETCRRCIECDTTMAVALDAGRRHTIYPCLNGLTDCASPIVIEGIHVANVFVGQFLTAVPDEARFRAQAEEFGFDVDDYLAALREVPVVDAEKIPIILELLARMTRVITNLSVERKRAVDDQARQSLILDTIPQSVFWKDLDGKYLGCNATFARAAGLRSPGEVVGKTDFELPWPRSEAEAFCAADQAVIEARQPRLHVVEPVPRADGARIMADTSRLPLTDVRGTTYGLVGIYADITEQMHAAETVRESEVKYRTVVENVLEGVLVFSDRQRLFTNRRYLEILGYSAEEFAELDFMAAVHPEDRPGVFRALSALGQVDPSRPTFECRVITKSGDTRWLDARGAALTWEGRPAVIVFAADITERKHQDAALRESEARFRAAFMTGLDALYWATLHDGRICEVNEAFEALFGYSRDETVGRTSLELGLYAAPVDRARMVAGLREHGFVKDMELAGVRKDGAHIVVSLSARKVLQSGEEYLLGVLRDITEQKRAEREREELSLDFARSPQVRSRPPCDVIAEAA